MTDNMNSGLIGTRRQALKLAAAGVLTLVGGGLLARSAGATPETTAQKLTEIAKGAAVQAGAIDVKLPEIAEDGSQVPITISTDGPMPDGSPVRTIHVLAEKNPLPLVISFNLTPLLANTTVNTRIRLAETQDVVVAAVSEKGAVYTTRKTVKVTIGGCGG